MSKPTEETKVSEPVQLPTLQELQAKQWKVELEIAAYLWGKRE